MLCVVPLFYIFVLSLDLGLKALGFLPIYYIPFSISVRLLSTYPFTPSRANEIFCSKSNSQKGLAFGHNRKQKGDMRLHISFCF
jgi:hypothetical protein